MRLDEALQACQQAARRGYRVAQEHLQELEATIEQAAQEVKAKRQDLARGRVETSDIDVKLQAQLGEVVGELRRLQREFRTELAARGKQLEEFSIALFGRTMSGKSTLMEILTDGSGASIGTGAQRTTRDVRTYRWRELRVTDVPGVAAFEGSEDEDLAFEAAAHADLVIFLITDDAPQPAEADCLARVRKLGKPVLGICNVKFAISEDDDLRVIRRLATRHFDPQRLRAVENQFGQLAGQRLPRNRTRFVSTHLRGRFLAQREPDPSRRGALADLSRFDKVEREIVSIVVGQGTFLRTKSFIDASTVRTLDLSDRLLDFSGENATTGRVLVGKRWQTLKWREGFCTSGRTRIEKGVRDKVEELRKSIPSFAEDSYDRSDAGERWSREVRSANVERAVEQAQRELLCECRTHFDQIAKEFQEELRLAGDFAADSKISMDRVFDGKRAWRWSITLTSGGLSILALFLFSNPLVLVAGGVAIVGRWLSRFFEGRETKARRQRRELEGKLRKNVDDIERQLRTALSQWFECTLLRRVDVLVEGMSTVVGSLFDLADTQRDLAWRLNGKQKLLHRQLLREALSQLGTEGVMSRMIRDVARVPGDGMVLVLERGARLPDRVRSRLEELLGEPVWLMSQRDSPFWTLCNAIGIRDGDDIRGISIEEDIRVAHVPVDVLDRERRARVRLAQQLTELHVMKEQSR